MTHTEKLTNLWERKSHSKIDWLELETDMRMVLRDYKNSTVSAENSLKLISEFIAAHTFRGCELHGL